MKAILLVLFASTALQAQSAGFVVRLGNDTLAVENFTLTSEALVGAVTMRGQAAKPTAYRVELVNGLPRTDTVPFINLSFAHVELITRRAVATGRDAGPVHIQVGGQTMTAQLRRTDVNTLVLGLSGVDLALTVDSAGRILRGAVPVQNLSFERVVRAELAAALGDYSAPAGASFTAQNVTIPTPAGHTLAGTLTLPKHAKPPHTVVVTISGSGLQERDAMIPGITGYRPFREFAEALGEKGIGVLRYDDRSYGESTGDASQATSEDFAQDVRAVVAYLRGRSDVDAKRIFLLGHSEGGMIAPMVAATDTMLRGIMLLAGPAYTGRRILAYQTGATDEVLDQMAASQPWLRYFMAYDPLTTAQRVRVPVLILQGATDRQITAEQADTLAAALRTAGNSDVSVHVLPDVNHLFLRDPRGYGAGYAALPDKTVVADVVALLSEWILQRAK